MTIRIIIADDHSVVRQGLRMFLGLDPDLQVVGEAVNGAEAVARAEALRPDVVLMDLIMPVMSGLEATAEIRRRGLPTQVIVVTSVIEEAAVTAVIRAGAIGYLLKDTEADDLRRAIKAAAAGRPARPRSPPACWPRPRSRGPDALTDRENEVLRLAAEGLRPGDRPAPAGQRAGRPFPRGRHRRETAPGEPVPDALLELCQSLPRPTASRRPRSSHFLVQAAQSAACPATRRRCLLLAEPATAAWSSAPPAAGPPGPRGRPLHGATVAIEREVAQPCCTLRRGRPPTVASRPAGPGRGLLLTGSSLRGHCAASRW